MSGRFATIEAFVARRPIVVAFALGIVAAIFAASYLHQRERELIDASEPVTVFVTARDLPAGSLAGTNDIERANIPRRYVASDAINDAAALGNVATRINLSRGSQLTQGAIAPIGGAMGLAMKVPLGHRAITIAVDDVSGVGGFVRAGDCVDLLATFDFGTDASSKFVTITMLEAVQVLAVGQDALGAVQKAAKADRSKTGLFTTAGDTDLLKTKRPTVTLALSPDDVQKVVLAQEAGVLTLTLRHRNEGDARMNPAPTTIRQISGTEELLRPRRSAYREYRGK